MKTSRTFESLSAALIVAVLFAAPFIGGKDELAGTAALSVLCFAAALLLWTRKFAIPTAVLPLVVFVALVASSAIVTASLRATIEQTLYFAACAAAAIAASSAIKDTRWFTATLVALAGAGLLLGALGVREHRLSGQEWRVFATFASPGFFGGYLVMALPVTLAVFLTASSPVVVLITGLAWGFELAALLLTGTRLAIAAAGGSLVIFFIPALWTRCLERRQFVRLATILALAIVASAVAIAPTTYRVKGPAAGQQSHSGPFRIATIKGTINIVRANPILGTGAGTFEMVFPRYMVAGYTRMAHNGYLQLASEAGIPALAAAGVSFGALLLAGVRGLRSRSDSGSPSGSEILLTIGIIAALAGSLARNLLDSDIYNPAIGFTFWTLAGLVSSRAASRRVAGPHSALRLGLTAVLVLMACTWSLFSLGQQRATAAVRAIDNQDVYSALELYRSAAMVDPLNAEYWVRYGQILALSAGPDDDQWREGIAYVRRGVRLEPTRARHAISLARLLQSHGDTAGAVRAFRRALDMDPHATPAMLALARLLSGRDAEEMYHRLLKEEGSPFEQLRGVPEIVNPDYAWAHYYFGRKLLEKGEYKQAADHFRSAVERLERRKSFGLYIEAMESAGLADTESESDLDGLLDDSKAGLAEAVKKHE
ncbi:MAG: O-antigen ligase family protein [Armatimonadetes bacterium]|nr:O-antigen ligase family protein [Armatimonadota bacterium]